MSEISFTWPVVPLRDSEVKQLREILAERNQNQKTRPVLQFAKIECRDNGDEVNTDHINLPKYGTTKAAAFDLQCLDSITIQPKSHAIMETGLRAKIPEGYSLLLWSRSGLSAKQGIEKGAGLLDEDFRLQIKVILFNHSDRPVMFKAGDRVVQAILLKTEQAEIQWGEFPEYDDESDRVGGLGSTGGF
jgi:dUTP pyrophosphatase